MALFTLVISRIFSVRIGDRRGCQLVLPHPVGIQDVGDFFLEVLQDVPLLCAYVYHDVKFIDNVLDLALQFAVLVYIEQWDDEITQICWEISWFCEACHPASPFPHMFETDGLLVVLDSNFRILRLPKLGIQY